MPTGREQINSDRLRLMLKDARERAGFSQRELCKMLRRKNSYITKLESGELRKLDVGEVLAVLDALKVEPQGFFADFLRTLS